MANIKSQKKMAADILKCGINRIRVLSVQDAEEALTREDVRGLIRKGSIKKLQKKGSSRAASRKTLSQKKRGRKTGMGRRKGKKRATEPKKTKWIKHVKAQRKLLRELKQAGSIGVGDYRKLYLRAKGGFFRNKKHIMLYLKEHELLKKPVVPKKKASTAKAAKPATVAKAAKPAKSPTKKRTSAKGGKK